VAGIEVPFYQLLFSAFEISYGFSLTIKFLPCVKRLTSNSHGIVKFPHCFQAADSLIER
jgi:hypothetical protein